MMYRCTRPAPVFALAHGTPDGRDGWPDGPDAELDAWPRGGAGAIWAWIRDDADYEARIHLEGSIATIGLHNIACELAQQLTPEDVAGFRDGWRAAGGRPSFGGQITKAVREAMRVYAPRMPSAGPVAVAKPKPLDPEAEALDRALRLIAGGRS
jgi:hypothetical protein